MGFLFVDRIRAIDSACASGNLTMAADAPALPPWLIVEAVGQLAAWVAMRNSDFRSRPVAALVGEVRLTGIPPSGDLELEARIERVDGRAVLYSGAARTGGATVTEMRRCVGPMLPMEGFDDPDAVRARFDALCAGGSAAGGADRRTLPSAALETLPSAIEGERRARLCVPAEAPYFADHFPRKAVFPATLLADAQSRLAREAAAQALGVDPTVLRHAVLRDFKVRAFSEPGSTLELQVAVTALRGIAADVTASASSEGRRVATGRFEFTSAPPER